VGHNFLKIGRPHFVFTSKTVHFRVRLTVFQRFMEQMFFVRSG
jgi:hypothetical protein